MSQFKELFDYIRREKVVVVIGAGFSLKAGMPSCSKVCARVREKLPQDVWNPENKDDDYYKKSLQDLTQSFVEDWGEEGRNKLIKIIQPLFIPQSNANLSDHKLLRTISHFSKIHTTNYDTLVEDIYGQECYVIKKEEDFLNIPEGKVIILKPHGDFDNPDLIVITRSDYDNWFAENSRNLLWQELRRDVATKSILFIGYSFSDTNLQYLFRKLKASLKGSHRHFLISPGWQPAQVRKLEPYNIKYYDATGEVFLTELIEYLKKTINRDCARKITSPVTCQKFNRYHNNEARITINSDGDNVIRVTSLNGAREKMTFNVSSEKGKLMMEHLLPDLEKSPVTGLPIPSLVLTSKDFANCSLTLNEIELFTSEIAKVIIQPCQKKGKCVVKVPKFHLTERLSYVFYSVFRKEIVHVIDSDFFKLTLTTTLNEATNIFTTNFTFDYKDKFSSIEAARNLLKIPLAVELGYPFSISGLEAPSIIDLPRRPQEDKDLWSNDIISLYLDLLTIVEDCGVVLDYYPGFSEDNLEAVIYLVAYLRKLTVHYVDHKPLHINFSINDKECPEKPGMIVGNRYGFIETFEGNKIIFGGKTIDIPKRLSYYSDCTVLENELSNNDIRQIKLSDNGASGYFLFADNDHYKIANKKSDQKLVEKLQQGLRFIRRFPFMQH